MGRAITVGKIGDIADGGCRVVAVDGKEIAVFRVGEQYYAIDDRCPHAGSSLSGGTVDESLVVTCPWHHWRFRLTDGAWADNPRIRTGCYRVEVEGDEIRLQADPI